MNLRAALFRCLNELKKKGGLGREAVLRKTMLDECKGDKFEEILVLFSATVVRQSVLSKRRKKPAPPAQTLGTVTNIGPKESALLLPLTVAHRVSLNKVLEKRAARKSKFTALSNRIEGERHQLQERREATATTRQSLESPVSTDVAALIKREVQQNWIGNAEGCRLLLSGDRVDTSDAILTANFNEVWQSLQNGMPSVAGDSDPDLLARLDFRIREQNDRLRLWRDYHDNINKSKGAETLLIQGISVKAISQSSSNIFSHHQGIRIGQELDNEASIQSEAVSGYADIISSMKEELQKASRQKIKQDARPKRSNATVFPAKPLAMAKPVPVLLSGSQKFGNDLFSPLKDASHATAASPVYAQSHEPSKMVIVESYHDGGPDTELAEGGSGTDSDAGSDTVMVEENQQVPYSPAPLSDSYQDYKPLSRGRAGSVEDPQVAEMQLSDDRSGMISETDRLGDQLSRLNLHHRGEHTHAGSSPEPKSATAAPPESPTRPVVSERPHRPTLAERTRVSMAFTSSEDIHHIPSSPPKKPDVDEPLPSVSELPQIDRRASLAERALQSMTLASLKPQNDIMRRGSKRERPRSSLHPINQFETPRRSTRATFAQTEDEHEDEHVRTEITPKEKLFSEEAEYESVFKSRPKIAMSPVMSPSLDDMSELDSSPLGALGGSRQWGR